MLVEFPRQLIAPLFVPGDRPERFSKAAESAADAIILDLEDAVDASRRNFARTAIAERLAFSLPVVVRINAVGTPDFNSDIAMLAHRPPDAIMVAKAESSSDIRTVVNAIGHPIRIIALIETARGLHQASEILAADHVVGCAFGSLDFALDIGCAPDWEALLHARSEIVLRSRLAQKAAPIDGVSVVFNDPSQVAHEARKARTLGFGGKLAIHPRQIAPIVEAFMPSEDEIAWATRILAGTQAGATFSNNGAMVDRPVIARAQSILSIAQARAQSSPTAIATAVAAAKD